MSCGGSAELGDCVALISLAVVLLGAGHSLYIIGGDGLGGGDLAQFDDTTINFA